MFERNIQEVQEKPLNGKRILVTRTREQASTLSNALRSLGAIPVEFPTIRIVPPLDWQLLDHALTRLFSPVAAYDWLIFTSVNGVQICCNRLLQLGYEPQRLQGVRIAAIGPATAAALVRYGLHADIVPEAYIAEGVAAALREEAHRNGKTLQGQRVLLARAAEARRVLIDELQQAGAQVDVVAAYYTETAAADDEQGQAVLRLLQERRLSCITFTSSSTVRNFVAWLNSTASTSLPLVTDHGRPAIACIGPVTAHTAREHGLPVDIEATEFTIDGLVQAIIDYKEISR